MRFTFWLALGCAVLVTVPTLSGCGGSSSSKKKKKKKKKKVDPAKAAEAALNEISEWYGANEGDLKALKTQVGKMKKKHPKAKEALDNYYKDAVQFAKDVVRQKVGVIAGNAKNPMNEAYLDKYVGEFADLLKEAEKLDPELAKEIKPDVDTECFKIYKTQYDKDITKFVRANRTKTAEIIEKTTAFKAKLEPLGEVAAKLMAKVVAVEEAATFLSEWMKRTPPDEINLIEEKHKDAWSKIENIEVAYEDGAMVVTCTGEGKKDFGVLLCQGYWYTDFGLECTFEIVKRGWQVMGRGHPPRSGQTEILAERIFGAGEPVQITFKIQGDDITIGGAVKEATRTTKKMAEGGGVGIYMGAGAKVRFLNFTVRKLN
jgi:hypothetical protein